MKRFERVNYRNELFDFLRGVPSDKFFTVTEDQATEQGDTQ